MTCTDRCQLRRRRAKRAYFRWMGRAEQIILVIAVVDALLPRRRCDSCGALKPLFRIRRPKR